MIANTAFLAALTILFIAGADMDWTGRALAQAVAVVLVGGIAIAWLTFSGAVSLAARRWPVRDALAFGLPLLPHALGAVAMASIDRFALIGLRVHPPIVARPRSPRRDRRREQWPTTSQSAGSSPGRPSAASRCGRR